MTSLIRKEFELVEMGINAVLSGAIIAEESNSAAVINRKGNLRDVVTEADLEINKVLREKLIEKGWDVISEESPLPSRLQNNYWVIDPIDGTANFANGIPYYAVSVGWLKEGQPSLGFVCAPALNEFYATLSNKTSYLNGKAINHVHEISQNALVAASFAAKAGSSQYLLFQQVNESTRGCLRTGSAALNLCWTASNKFQACFGLGAKVWDVAAGLALNIAAGSRVEIFSYPDNVTIDYCVGSKEVVSDIIIRAKSHGLWREML